MAKLSRKKGTTSQIFHVFIQDNTSTAGAGKTGLAFDTASLACKYVNPGGTLSAAITLETITTLGTYAAPTSNAHMRFKELNSASPSAGMYEIHVHNDWMNLTGGSFVIMMHGATGMAPLQLEIDLQADANVTHVSGTAQSAGDLATMITAVDDYVDSEVGAIKTKTDFLPSATAGTAGGVSIVGSQMNLVDAPNATAVTAIQNGLGTSANQATIISTLSTIAGYIDTEVTTILARLGAWTGTGINNILGAFQALLSKVAAAPSDIGGTFSPATDSVEAIRDTAPLGTAMRGTDDALLAASYTAPPTAGDIRSAVGMASANLDTQLADLPTALENADAYLDRADAIETGITPRKAHRIEVAGAAGVVSGAATTTVLVKNPAGTKTRVTATVDADGNRSAITLTDLT